MNPIDYRDFAALARRHCGKCVLFARHAERPNLPPDDPSYGVNLPITDAGREMALQCGRDLRKAVPASEWSFWSSGLLRARLTAAAVAEGVGVPSPVIHDSVKPASDAAEIWSVSIPKSATIKFFAPLSGIVAEKPEWLPRRKAGK